MTIKVGDEVEVYRDGRWSGTTYTVLYIQDIDKWSDNRQWVVVAFGADIPQVFKLNHVRKKPLFVSHVTDGYVTDCGMVYPADIIPSVNWTPVTITYTTVGGVIDPKTYKIERRHV